MLRIIMVWTLTHCVAVLFFSNFSSSGFQYPAICASLSYSAKAVIDLEIIDVTPQVVALSFNYEL